MPPRVAAVIGINYTAFPPGAALTPARAALTPLRYAEADAAAMDALLRAAGYAVETLCGAAATRPAIFALLRRQVRAAGSDGLLLVYFAGHGQVDPDDAMTAYLLPVDADPQAPVDRGIPLDELAQRHLGAVPTALVLLDCCHSGYAVGLRGGAVAAGREFGRLARTSFVQVSGRIVLTACAGDDLAREFARLGHGVFTHYILEWWRTSPTGDDLSLASFVAAGLEREKLPAPVRGGVQEGRLLLRDALPSGSAPPPESAPPPPASNEAPAPAPASLEAPAPPAPLESAPPPPAPVRPAPPIVTLDRTTRKALYDALLVAFPNTADLAQMVEFELGENLNAIAGGSRLSETVFTLLQWAEARGQVAALVTGAVAANPTNPALRALAVTLGLAPA